ncbi:disease resistance protein RUN1 [Cryptomeria japonica]|uniref:disease resistance protein RUN1 n=1 Tax=Cryptomeria japonica TaxID=3369 RepID=UPI0027D9E6EB|nr:disease resistance protein RUN1 [Cryptomeria japonica]
MNYYNQDNSLNKAVMDSTNGADWSLTLSSLGPKIFVIRGDYFNKAIYEVSRDLVWLRWSEIGQRNLPSQLSLKNLSVLELYEDYLGRGGNHLKELWETDSDAPVQLRVLVISGCLKFQRFPTSIGRLNLLKKIVIVHGFNLTILPEEFCHLRSLEDLVLHACRQLSSLPTNFGDLRSLRSLDLSCCGKLSMMPDSFKKLMLLQYLNLESCHELILASEDFENITKLEYINLIRCSQLKELPRHLTNQACLRELYLAPSGRFIFMGGKMRLRELPINIGQLSRIQKISIGSELLTTLPTSLGDLSFLTNLQIGRCPNLESLPTSLGDLSSLTTLVIYDCSSLESLPTSLGDLPSLRNLSIVACKDLFSLPASLERLNLLEHLRIDACPINCLPSGLSNLKDIVLKGTQVCRISMSEDRYPRLESLELKENHHLTEIEAVPTTVRSIEMSDCKMLKKLRVPCDLVNLERLQISYCPELEELPSFAHSTSLREFELVYGCYRIQKIKGLENCTRLESLRVETCWEVPGIESLEGMEKLRVVELRASKGSVIERCIQTIEKWPDEISICMPAVPEASSIVDSLPLSPNLVLFHSLQIGPMSTLVKLPPSNGDALMLCCVINSVSSFNTLVPPQGIFFLKEGRWAWVGVYKSQNGNEFIIGTVKNDTCKVEKCLAVRGDKQKVVEAFHSWLPFLRKLGI